MCHVAPYVVLSHDSPEFALVAGSWLQLSDPIRAAILALIRTSPG